MRYHSIFVFILSVFLSFSGMKKKSKRGTTARDTEKLYIGHSGKDMKGRVQHHIREATKKRRPKQAIQRKLKKIFKGMLHYSNFLQNI